MKLMQPISKLVVTAATFFLMCTTALANIEGSPTQNFNPVYGGRDFTTVHSSSTVKKYHLNVGLFLDYALETLPVYPSVINPDIDDKVLFATLGLGFGITDRWDVGMSIPYVANQSVDDVQLRGQFKSRGMTEIRFLSKFRLMDFQSGGGLAVLGSIGLNQTKNLPYVGEDPDPTFNIQVLLDHLVGQWRLAGNLGYRMASPGPQISGFTFFQPLGDAVFASAAARYQFNENWFGLGELWASMPNVDMGAVDRQDNSFEALIGGIYKQEYESSEELNVHFGLTKGLNNGFLLPP